MSNIEDSKVETGPPDSDYESNLKWLVDSLPNYLNPDPEHGNYALLEPIAAQVDELDDDLQEVDDAKSVQRARTRPEIEKLASLVSLAPEGNEGRERYRARTIARFQLNTSEGVFTDIFGSLAEILDIEVEDIWYADWMRLYNEDKQVFFLPYSEVKAHPLDDDNIDEIVGDLTAAGKSIKAMYDGSHRAVSAEKYENTNWTGYDAGATSLDSEGNIIEGGGTAGGLLDLN